MVTPEALDAQRAARKAEVDKDWAKVTDSLIDKILRTSKRVGPQAEFPEWAAEFNLGPNASDERKLDLRNKLAALRKHPSRSYNTQLKAVMEAARSSLPLISTKP